MEGVPGTTYGLLNREKEEEGTAKGKEEVPPFVPRRVVETKLRDLN